MKNCFTLILVFMVIGLQAQTFKNARQFESVNPNWAPFYHGVASGDPLQDRVIIWTRVTPEDTVTNEIEVNWTMATDPNLSEVIATGTFTTSAARDYTVKVDVDGLEAGTTYYYGFQAMGSASLTGRTRTASIETDHLRFGVVSCSNYPAGYFNGYQRLSERNDLDAIIHLGDYIYEYANGVYGDSSLTSARLVEPNNEIITAEDYRMRYSTYRLDTMLARAHQQHPFIAIWDDHESANDSYKDGAENHTEGEEGDWPTRLATARQVYFEWMPIRDNADGQIYRKLEYGDLADLMFLDTRIEGREVQINSVADSALYAEDRTMLGAEQKAWLLDNLSSSNAKWKVVPQQVIFAQFNVGWFSAVNPALSYDASESLFLDIWDGYPAERSQIISHISDNEIDNVVFLTGDFHCSFGYDVSPNPIELSFIPTSDTTSIFNYVPTEYDPETGAGSIAVEFATPSISSANFDENLDIFTALLIQNQLNNPVMSGDVSLGNPNPHLKYVDLVDHGYFILDLTEERVSADWYYVELEQPDPTEEFGMSAFSDLGTNYLQLSETPSALKAEQELPAPSDPPSLTSTRELVNAVLLGVYPNPVTDEISVQISATQTAELSLKIYDLAGQELQNLETATFDKGIYTIKTDVSELPSGVYTIRLSDGVGQRSQQFVKK